MTDPNLCTRCGLDVFAFSDVEADVIRNAHSSRGTMHDLIARETAKSFMAYLESYMEEEDLVFARRTITEPPPG